MLEPNEHLHILLLGELAARLPRRDLTLTLCECQALGCKSGAGFYRYAMRGTRPRIERPEDGVAALIEQPWQPPPMVT